MSMEQLHANDSATSLGQEPHSQRPPDLEGYDKIYRQSNAQGAGTAENALPNAKINGSSIEFGGGDSGGKATDDVSAPASSQGGILNVVKDIGKGFVDEAIDHPGRVLGDFAVGAAVGAAATVAGPVLATIGAVGFAGYELYKHGGPVKAASDLYNGAKDLVHEASIDYAPSTYSATERTKAKDSMEHVGAVGMDLTSMTLGSVAGGMAIKMIEKGMATGVASTASEAGSDQSDMGKVASPAKSTAETNLAPQDAPQAVSKDAPVEDAYLTPIDDQKLIVRVKDGPFKGEWSQVLHPNSSYNPDDASVHWESGNLVNDRWHSGNLITDSWNLTYNDKADNAGINALINPTSRIWEKFYNGTQVYPVFKLLNGEPIKN